MDATSWLLEQRVISDNKILRIIQNHPFCSHVNDLYTEFNLLLLDHMHTQQLLVLVFKCLFYNQLVPSVFHSYFVYNRDIHNYATRTRSDLHIFVPNSSFGKRRIKYKCSVLWSSSSSSNFL